MHTCIQFDRPVNFTNNHSQINALAASKEIAPLMLIAKLIGYKSCEIPNNRKLHSSHKLANALLCNFQKSNISIIPPKNDDLLAFVKHTINDAIEILTSPTNCLYKFAVELMGQIQNLNPNDPIQLRLKSSWKEFTIQLFKHKLSHTLTHHA